ncbi:hypothetical protein LTR56_023762 [Elasticomyces elasticus]|nr:hypothetical protein LTR56_023762 [Elasticomyces elasticus]KAK3662368.1 hypothetical protein LTR22_006901 [Elasticomyces elasticus]KAK4924694.1 hypothetical protein LTR49_008143 [Elasticomyces elasticus]KAK5766901.1 hypothetical protein LTS12_002977 [Elasticomyces elasticus]
MHEVLGTLEDDALIKIVVGEDEGLGVGIEIFHIRQSLLEAASHRFTHAIKEERQDGESQVTLTIPDDDVFPWKMLLHWLVKRELPSDELYAEDFAYLNPDDSHLPLIRCWILGERFDLTVFQNLIMEMIKAALSGACDGRYLSHASLQEAFQCTEPGSGVRLLAVEDIAYQLEYSSGVKVGMLDKDFGGVTGFIGELMEAVLRKHGNEMSGLYDKISFASPSYTDPARFVKEEPLRRATAMEKRRVAVTEECEDDVFL